MGVSVRVTKRDRDGRPIYYGVFLNGKLQTQVVRTKAEADTIAARVRERERYHAKLKAGHR